jgi:hypothetical protein
VVIQLQDLDDLLDDLGVLLAEDANETLGAAKQGLFMLVRCNKLKKGDC